MFAPARLFANALAVCVALCMGVVTLGPLGIPASAQTLQDARVLSAQGRDLHNQARYAEAETHYKRALAIRERALGLNHQDVAESLTDLGILLVNQARYAEAEALYKRALAIREKSFGPDHADVGRIVWRLAFVYRHQNLYDKAMSHYRRALAILEKALGSDDPEVAATLRVMASMYETGLLGHAEAEELYKRALASSERALGPDDGEVARTLMTLGILYNHQGRYREAEPLLQRALAIRQKLYGADHPATAYSANHLAVTYRQLNRHADALALARSATRSGVPVRDFHLGLLETALAQDIISKWDAVAESLDLVQRTATSSTSIAVDQLAVRLAAGSDDLARLVRRDQDLAVEAGTLDRSLIAMVSLESTKRNPAEVQRVRDRLQTIAAERGQIQATLAQRFPRFAAFSRSEPLSLKNIQALLREDEALVVLDLGIHKSYAWAATATDAGWVSLAISARDVATGIQALRKSLTFDSDRPFDVAYAHSLYAATLGRVAHVFATKKRLTVVTNGALSALPLQLLVTKDPAGKALKDIDWLVRSHAVTNLPSVASLKTLRTTAAASGQRKPMIAFADPVFSKSTSADGRPRSPMRSLTSFADGARINVQELARSLPPLPGTRREVEAIGKVLKVNAADIKVGLAATEVAVKSIRLDQYRIVYFATHGLVAGDLREFTRGRVEPALAFTFPDRPDSRDDGLLSTSEVTQLKLDADWVVLSACNTAAGDTPGAEALSGLARAFFYAGARSLIVSHWAVSDNATVDLMTGVFGLMQSNPGLTHGEALQGSMLAMLDRAATDDDLHPRLWAPFVVVGEPKKPN